MAGTVASEPYMLQVLKAIGRERDAGRVVRVVVDATAGQPLKVTIAVVVGDEFEQMTPPKLGDDRLEWRKWDLIDAVDRVRRLNQKGSLGTDE